MGINLGVDYIDELVLELEEYSDMGVTVDGL